MLSALLVIWSSLGDHVLYPPDEGRYGSVSAAMVESGNWLEPQLREAVHVTKPPLTYWAQAACISVLGPTELAVRIPSALAATLTVIVLFWFVRRTCGPLLATLAVGVYSVMPLPVIIGRLGITDSLLNAWWWLALCCGYLAITADERRTRWVIGFWMAVALIGLTKGPLLLAPVVILGAWIFLRPSSSGEMPSRWQQLARMRVPLGLPLALAPLAVVAYLYWQANPERTASVWRSEFVDRLAGTGVHHDPVWEFIPAFLAGFFPATSMLALPWTNLSWRRVVECFRAGDLRALMLVAVVLPFVGFSLLSGKQLTYILPLAAPLAFLAALTLRRWIAPGTAIPTQTIKPLAPPERVPEVRILCALSMCAWATLIPVVGIAAMRAGALPPVISEATVLRWSLVFVPAVVGWLVCVGLWHLPSRRALGVFCAFAGMIVMYLGLHRVEDFALSRMSSKPLAERLAATHRPVLAFDLPDLTLDFYMGRWTHYTYKARELPEWIAAHPDGIIVTQRSDMSRARAHQANVLDGYSVTGEYLHWPMKRVVVLERTAP
jgi:4-amino-4-deoxy-L-arabinose transferase-like glycosyltransferase